MPVWRGQRSSKDNSICAGWISWLRRQGINLPLSPFILAKTRLLPRFQSSQVGEWTRAVILFWDFELSIVAAMSSSKDSAIRYNMLRAAAQAGNQNPCILCISVDENEDSSPSEARFASCALEDEDMLDVWTEAGFGDSDEGFTVDGLKNPSVHAKDRRARSDRIYVQTMENLRPAAAQLLGTFPLKGEKAKCISSHFGLACDLQLRHAGEDRRRIPLLRRAVDPNLDNLDCLRLLLYKWLPGRKTCRPDAAVAALKAEFFERSQLLYETSLDCILHTIFGFPVVEGRQQQDSGDGGKLAVLQETGAISPARAFLPNRFHYCCPADHFVMWYYAVEEDERDIDGDISEGLQRHYGCDSFDYAYYENPKPSCKGGVSRTTKCLL